MLSSGHYEVNHDKEPIRLFEISFLEFFTHIHPAVVLLIWVPVSVVFLSLAVLQHPAQGLPVVVDILLGFVLGLFLWTLTEYTLRRFVFHFRPRSSFQERLTYLFHGIHHRQPKCKTRLVMPPAVSIPLALLFLGGFYLVLGVVLGAAWWVAPTFAGFITGYIAYDMLPYAIHHFPVRKGALKYLKRYHLRHHYKTPDQRYGVSSPLWDVFLGTRPPDSQPDLALSRQSIILAGPGPTSLLRTLAPNPT